MRFLTLLFVLLLVNACSNFENNKEDQPITKNDTEQVTPLAEDKTEPIIEEVKAIEKEAEPTVAPKPIQKTEPVVKKPKKVKKKTTTIDQPIEEVTIEVARLIDEIEWVEVKEEDLKINNPNIVVATDTSDENTIAEVEVGGFDANEQQNLDKVLDLLRKKFIESAEEEEDDDGILGFATTTVVDSNAVASSEDSNSISGITTKGGTVAAKKAVKKGAFDEVIEAERTDQIFGERRPIDQSKVEFVRRPKVVQQYYTGYKIELMTVYNKSLELDDELFKTFGGLTFVKEANKTVYYLGDFKTKKALEDFLAKVVVSRFPDAKGTKFADGVVAAY